jgi:hypothetical protein
MRKLLTRFTSWYFIRPTTITPPTTTYRQELDILITTRYTTIDVASHE